MHFRDIYLVIQPGAGVRLVDFIPAIGHWIESAEAECQYGIKNAGGVRGFDEKSRLTTYDITPDPSDGTVLLHIRSAVLGIAGVESLKRAVSRFSYVEHANSRVVYSQKLGIVLSWTCSNWDAPGHHTAAMKKRHAHARLLEEERDRAARERAQMERLRKAAAKVPAPKLIKKLPRARALREALRENPYPREAANRTAAKRGARRIGYGVYNVFQHYWYGQGDPLYAVLSRRGPSVDWVEVTLSAAERRRMDEVATTILADEGTTAAEKRTARSWLTPR